MARLTIKHLHPRFVAELTAFCTQLKRVYSHAWRDGDAVKWDNPCTLRRATPFDKTKYKRKLHRTTIAAKAPRGALAKMPDSGKTRDLDARRESCSS